MRKTQENATARTRRVLPSHRTSRHHAEQTAFFHEELIKLRGQIRAGTLFRILPVETSALLMMFFLRSPVFSARALGERIYLAPLRKETFERLRRRRRLLRAILKNPAVVRIAHRRIRRREQENFLLYAPLRPEFHPEKALLRKQRRSLQKTPCRLTRRLTRGTLTVHGQLRRKHRNVFLTTEHLIIHILHSFASLSCMQTFLVCLLSLCLYLCCCFYFVFFVSWSQSVRLRVLARSLRLQIPACFPERLLETAADSLVKVPQDLRQNKKPTPQQSKNG